MFYIASFHEGHLPVLSLVLRSSTFILKVSGLLTMQRSNRPQVLVYRGSIDAPSRKTNTHSTRPLGVNAFFFCTLISRENFSWSYHVRLLGNDVSQSALLQNRPDIADCPLLHLRLRLPNIQS